MLPLLRAAGCLLLALPSMAPTRPAPATQAPGPATSSIALLALDQPACSLPLAQRVLKVKLAYRIAAAENAPDGYAVSIKFQGTDPRQTFSVGRQGQAMVTSKRDTLTLDYPLATTWQDERLYHPVSCYLYLHRYTDATHRRSIVIAQTHAISLQECP